MSRRPARDVTRGGSVKNKNKNPESECLGLRRVAWKFPGRAEAEVRGRADGEGTRAAQPGPARPAAHPCNSGRGARRGSAGAPRPAAGRWPRAGARRPAERSAGPWASMCVLAAAGALTARAPHPRGPAGARGRGRPGGGGGVGPSGPRRA